MELEKSKRNDSIWLMAGGLLVVGWLIYFYFFYQFYQEATYFAELNADAIMTSLFVANFYSTGLMKYLIWVFSLSSINVILLIIFKVKLDNNAIVTNHKNQFILILLTATAVISSIALLINMIWPITVLVILATGVIGYTVYALYRKTYKEDKQPYEDDDVIRKAGPFESEASAELYYDEFYVHWYQHFDDRHFRLLKDVYAVGNQYYVEAYIQSNNKGEIKA